MLSLKFLIIICFNLKFTFSQNISQIKCNEYAQIKLRPSTFDPYVAKIRKTFSFGVAVNCVGTLISDQFVITSGDCGNDLFVNFSQAFFDNANTITEAYPYYLKENGDYRNNIILFKLRNKINFDQGIHRPVCLWVYDFVPVDQTIYLKNNNVFTRNPELEVVQLYRQDICELNDNLYDETKFCFHTPNGTLRPDFEPFQGSPTMYHYKLYDLFYLYGIYTNRNDNLLSGVKLNAQHIEWIESIVWKEYKSSLLTCGEVKIERKPYITFGSSSFHGQYPWHVAVYRREGFRTKRYICGGTIINNQTVLTAAHCVANENGVTSPDSLTVELGKYDLNIFSQNSYEIQVQAVLPHEKFNIKILENDIAILKLKSFITFTNFIQPICITNDTEVYEENYGIGIVPGWGRDENNYPTNLLNQASLPIRTNSDCRESNRNFFPNYLNENNFCAGYQNGTNVCTGDSGGGMIFKKAGRWYIKGIVSLGVALPTEQQCDITQLVLFTDVTKFYDWIIVRA